MKPILIILITIFIISILFIAEENYNQSKQDTKCYETTDKLVQQ